MCSLRRLTPSDLQILVQNPSAAMNIPSEGQLIDWATVALDTRCAQAEITLRIVDPIEGAALNAHYRHKQGPTNVLSFPYTPPRGMEGFLLGDIVICASVVEQEALDQQKPLEAHWAHMVVHGILHLLGYDHEQVEEAVVMEALENKLLRALHFEPPYGEQSNQ